MTIINMTPHSLNIHTSEGVVTISPSGCVARVEMSRRDAGTVDGIDVSSPIMGEIVDLPNAGCRPCPDCDGTAMDVSQGYPCETCQGYGWFRSDNPDDVVYVSSFVVAMAAAEQGRTDVLSPGELVRDESGRPIGCRGLSRPAGAANTYDECRKAFVDAEKRLNAWNDRVRSQRFESELAAREYAADNDLKGFAVYSDRRELRYNAEKGQHETVVTSGEYSLDQPCEEWSGPGKFAGFVAACPVTKKTCRWAKSDGCGLADCYSCEILTELAMEGVHGNVSAFMSPTGVVKE